MYKKYLILPALFFIISCSGKDKVEIIDSGEDYLHLSEDMIDPFANPSLNSFWSDMIPVKDILAGEKEEKVFSYRLYIGTDDILSYSVSTAYPCQLYGCSFVNACGSRSVGTAW